MLDIKYSYIFLFILPKLIPLIIVFTLRKDLRRIIIINGLKGGFLGLVADWILVQFYWQPYTLFGQGIVSMEAFLYGFSAVALVSVLYLFISGKKAKFAKYYESLGYTIKNILQYVVAIIACGAAVYLFIKFFNTNVMITICVACIVAVICVLIRLHNAKLIKETLWRSFIAVVIMMAIAIISYGLWRLMYPNYWHDVLIMEADWNIMIFEFIPVSELMYWVIILGAVEIGFGEAPGRKLNGKSRKKNKGSKK